MSSEDPLGPTSELLAERAARAMEQRAMAQKGGEAHRASLDEGNRRGSLQRDSLQGTRIAIGGAGQGIGAACARLLAKRGAKLLLCARNEHEVEQLASELRKSGASAWGIAADLGTDAGSGAFARAAKEHLGGLDIGLICAGVSQRPQLLFELDREALLEQLQGNTIAPALAALALTRTFVDFQILVIGSLVTARPAQAGLGPYTAAKQALDSLVRTLAEELWPRVRVNALALGPVQTRLHEEAGTPRELSRTFPTPDEIAPLVLELLGERTRGLSGRCIDAEAFVLDPAAALWGDGRLAMVPALHQGTLSEDDFQSTRIDTSIDLQTGIEVDTVAAEPAAANPPSEPEPGRAPSPRVRRALRETAGALQRYPQDAARLVRRIAELHQVDPEQILLSGGGATSLLERALVAVGRAGDELVSPFPTFEILSALASRAGLRHRPVPARQNQDGLFAPHQAEPLLAAIGPRTRAVYVATPDNPTGVSLPEMEATALRGGLGRNVALILDEAWSLEIPSQGDPSPDAVSLNEGRGCPLVRLRSLSKLYGLAGLRVGYAIASPAFASLLRRLEPPFPLGSPQIAAALATLDELPRARRSAMILQRKRARLAESIRALGLLASEGSSPLILIRDPKPGANVGPILFALRAAQVAVQEAHWDPAALSISVGSPAQDRRALAAIARARQA